MTIFPNEMYDRVIELKDKYDNYDLAKILNQEFHLELDQMALKNYMFRKGIKRTVKFPKRYPNRSIFTEEQQAYMEKHYKGIGPTEMASILNKKWGTEYKTTQVKAYYRKKKLNSGLDGRFSKGHEPWCKGMKGNMPKTKYNSGHFKKGHVPDTKKEVGTVAKRVDGYWIKIAEPNVWEQYHRVIYKQVYGEIPPNMNVDFKDGNKFNISPENLMLVSKSDHIKLNIRGYRFENAELTEAALNIIKIENAIEERRQAK